MDKQIRRFGCGVARRVKILLNYLLFICVLFTLHTAQAGGNEPNASISTHDDNNVVILDGYEYRYKKVLVPEYSSDNDPYYDGLITVLNSKNGLTVYQQRTNYSPGCDGMPAVSLLTTSENYSPFSSRRREKKFVIFCGSTGGPHNTIRVYAPGFGIVAALDFNRGAANLNIISNGEYIAKTVHEFWINSIQGKFEYAVLYQTRTDNWPILTFSREIDNINSNYYKEYATNDYNIFINDCEKNLRYGITSAVYSAIIGDKDMLKKIYNRINDATNGRSAAISRDLQQELNLNFQVEE